MYSRLSVCLCLTSSVLRVCVQLILLVVCVCVCVCVWPVLGGRWEGVSYFISVCVSCAGWKLVGCVVCYQCVCVCLCACVCLVCLVWGNYRPDLQGFTTG